MNYSRSGNKVVGVFAKTNSVKHLSMFTNSTNSYISLELSRESNVNEIVLSRNIVKGQKKIIRI